MKELDTTKLPMLKELKGNEQELMKVRNEISREVAYLIDKEKDLLTKNKEIREAMLDGMAQAVANGAPKKYEDDYISVTYIEPTVRAGVDAKKLMTEHYEVYKQVKKDTPVKHSIRVKVKEPEVKLKAVEQQSFIW